jgi:TolA-binding protein
MRTLALKLAAVGGGAALAAGASTAHASATAGGGALAAAGASTAATLTKLAVSLAIVGAAATGAVLWQRGSDARPSVQTATQQQVSAQRVDQATLPNLGAPPSEGRAVSTPVTSAMLNQAPVVSAAAAPTEPSAALPSAREASPAVEPGLAVAAVQDVPGVDSQDDSVAGTSRAVRNPRRHERRAVSAPVRNEIAPVSPNAAKSGDQVAVERVTGQANQQSEIELLRSARSALASRPREAYQLTEQHRSLYPQGVFTQERDALAVEALLRTGDLKLARELAEVFVKRYPSSPHSHRFRESMQLP